MAFSMLSSLTTLERVEKGLLVSLVNEIGGQRPHFISRRGGPWKTGSQIITHQPEIACVPAEMRTKNSQCLVTGVRHKSPTFQKLGLLPQHLIVWAGYTARVAYTPDDE